MTTDPFERAAARDRDERQRRRADAARTGFRVHLAVFVVAQVLLFVVWLLTSDDDFPWFLFPLLGWGIGLAAHAAVVYGRGTVGSRGAAGDT
jgi:hypothetical protein